MQYNRKITISTGASRKSTHWVGNELLWSEFAERLKTPQRTSETYQEYLALTQGEQANLKDVGGFVGGTLQGHRRKANAVTGRDLITLDLDNISTGLTEDILRRVAGLGCASVIYSTRKHSSYKPRLRIVVPTDRTMLPDEYEPIARKLADLIGIEFADPTTFDVSRLMYWPSCSKDSEYVYQVVDKPFVSADGMLGLYGNWHDISQWPQVPGADVAHRALLARQEDPTAKKGIVGAFCRCYDIYEAMEAFIPTAYDATDVQDRYSYLGGSTTGGAVIYEDGKFLYSHHATDPCSGKLVNAWDLVRLHKFGNLDDDAKEGTPTTKMPSWRAMAQLANSDGKVAVTLDKERLDRAIDLFDDVVEVGEKIAAEVDLDWMNDLQRDGQGNIQKTTSNVMLILEKDEDLKGKIVFDEFSNRGMAMGALPWNAETDPRIWSDTDSAGVRNHLENFYGVTGVNKIDDGMALIAFKHRINAVKAYLGSLQWDGTKRIDTLIHDYLGAVQNEYTKQVMRKSLTAAVARALDGAVKFDTMTIFAGPQGIGKSTLLAKLGKEWFCDSLEDFAGKEAAEIIQGQWIVELGELTAMSRAETNAIKQFLSKKDDVYRAAYGKHTQRYPRRCVFFGTSNDSAFLKDITGNRRFWPVSVGVEEATKSVFEQLDYEVDQIWAEAYTLYVLGEPLHLTGEAKRLSEEAQEEYREVNAKEGLIQEFLDKLVPPEWSDMSLGQRRAFLQGDMHGVSEERIERDKVCAMEVWCECLGGDMRYMKRQDSVEINNILSALSGWQRNKSMRRYGYCGKQRGFERVK